VPVTWSVDDERGMVRVRYTEPYTFEEWRTAVEEVERTLAGSASPFHHEIRGLVDRAEVGPPPDAFTRAVAAYVLRRPLILSGRRIVFVVRDKESAAVAWRQAVLYQGAGAVSSVFRSQDDAEDWLRSF
jgi:hypothetical protein